MMKRLAFLSTLPLSLLSLHLAACNFGGERRDTGECPAGETCSDLTPRGLSFHGNGVVNDITWSGPRATAIGGTQVVRLEYDDGDGFDSPLDIPYTADDDGGLGVRIEGMTGENLTIRGVASRKNYIRVMDSDGLLMDRKELSGAALERMELVAGDYESVPEDTLLAFVPGQRKLGIALYGDVQTANGSESQRIIDTSMQLTLPGSQRTAWDTVQADVVVGTYPLEVVAGNKPAATLDVVVVDGVDTISQLGIDSTIPPNQSRSFCFQARNAGRYVAGLTWTFNVDAVEKTQGDGMINRNCVSVTTTKVTGSVALQASAGGQSMALNLTVGTARTLASGPDASAPIVAPVRKLPALVTVEGDRAAM
jgi:hypothetical protein